MCRADTDPADAQFAVDTLGDRVELPVQDIQAHIGDWPADRHAHHLRRGRHPDREMGDIVRALGRAVGVEQRDARVEAQPLAGQFGRQFLAGGDQPTQGLQVRARPITACQPLQHGAHEGRHGLQDSDAASDALVQQQPGVVGSLVVVDLHAPADQQGCQELPDRDIEALAGGLGDGILRAELQIANFCVQVVKHATLFDHGAFGQAGRTGGKDDVSQVGGSGAGAQVRLGQVEG